MEQHNARFPVPETGSGLARRTTAGVAVAVVALLATQALVNGAGVELGGSGSMAPFATVPLIGTTVVAGIGAAIAYAVVDRFTDRSVRNYLAVAAVVFTVMLVPVFAVTSSMGITPAGQALLVFYHVLVAVPLVGFIVGAMNV